MPVFAWVILVVTAVLAAASVVLQRKLRAHKAAAPAGPEPARWEKEGGTDLTAPAMAQPAAAPVTPATQPPPGARVRPSGGSPAAQAIIGNVLKGLQEVPPPPGALLQIVRELDDVASSAKSVAAIVSNEPVLTATLLRVVNSAALGLRRQILTPEEAVAYLGFSAVKSLFLRLKLGQLFKAPRTSGRCYDVEALWGHSIVVAQLAEHIAKRSRRVDPSLASTIGLLHDIGKVAINSQFPQVVHKLWEPAGKDADDSDVPADESFLARERRLFGADHAFMGSFLAARWELPGELVEAIRLHHVPGDQLMALPEGLRRATFAVHVANQLAKYCQVYCDDMEIDIIQPAVTNELGLPNDLDKLLDESTRKVINRSAMLSPEKPKPARAA